MPLVQAPVTDDRYPHAVHLLEYDPERPYRALEHRGEGDIDIVIEILQQSSGFLCLVATLLGQVHVHPSGEKVFQVPFALTVSAKHQFSRHEGSRGYRCRFSLQAVRQFAQFLGGDGQGGEVDILAQLHLGKDRIEHANRNGIVV